MAESEAPEVLWSPSALRDVEATHRFASSRSSRAARTVVRSIKEGVDRIRAHPEIGPVAEDIEPVGRHRHLVVRPYRVI